MENIRFVTVSLLLSASLLVLCLGVLGTWRFRSALNRLHAAAVNDTLGLLLAMLAMAVAGDSLATSLKYLLVLLLLWISSPLSSHLIAQTDLLTADPMKTERLKSPGGREDG